jgi:heme-degrading monooxygenase HmoA
MIERHITFNVHADKTGEFEQFFADEYGPAIARSPGFVRVELLREAESLTRYQMVLRWQDPDSAVGWRTSEVHQALQPALGSLVIDNEIQAYEVVA